MQGERSVNDYNLMDQTVVHLISRVPEADVPVDEADLACMPRRLWMRQKGVYAMTAEGQVGMVLTDSEDSDSGDSDSGDSGDSEDSEDSEDSKVRFGQADRWRDRWRDRWTG